MFSLPRPIPRLLVALVGASLAVSALPAPAADAAPRLVRAAAEVAPATARATVLGTSDPTQVIAITVGLTPRRPIAAPSPGAPLLTPADVARLYAPPAAAIAAVRRYLEAAGITVTGMEPDGLFLHARGSVGAVETALHLREADVRLPSGRVARAALDDASLPADIAPYVDGVAGVNDLVRLHDQLRRLPGGTGAVTGSAPNAIPTPHAIPAIQPPSPSTACASQQQSQKPASAQPYQPGEVAQVYGLSALSADPAVSGGAHGEGQTIALFELDAFSQSDITAYQQCYGIDMNGTTITVKPVDGGVASPGGAADEVALDMETALGQAYGLSTLLVYETKNSSTGVIDQYAAMVNDNQAQVISTSFGDCEQNFAPSDLRMEQQVFSQAAAQGQTVIAASGDLGSEDCANSSGCGTSVAAVDDPGAQPGVLSVGGTTLNPGQAPSGTYASERVWNDGHCGGGGGGQSVMWPQPAYQVSVNSSPGSAPRFHPQCGASRCREVPDVSFDADPETGFYVYCTTTPACNDPSQGRTPGWTVIGGTSAGAPVWAALLAMLDQNLGARGLGRVGEPHTMLYAVAAASPHPAPFRDVVTGNNDANGSLGGAYPATVGFDMASGVGSPNADAIARALPLRGYWMVASDGGIFAFGAAPFLGSTGGIHLNQPIVGMAPTPSGNGYWLVASDGGIFAFGGAHFSGSTGAIHLNRPIVGMAPTPGGGGYWLVASDGGVFAFGDAQFSGSTGALNLNRPIVGIAATPTGHGYWLVASDGGIFAFGDAAFHGSTGALVLNQPIVAMAATASGGGYWLTASDGGIFAFGDAAFYGSTGNLRLNRPIVGMAATVTGHGYWLVASDGGIFNFGDAAFYGSTGAVRLNQPVVGMAAAGA